MGIRDSIDLALSDWHSFAEFDPNADWPRQWAEHYVNQSTPQVYAWLKKAGIKFFSVVHWVERGLLKPGNSVPRFHMVWGTGQGLVATLVGNLENHENRKLLTLLFNHKVSRISHADGVVTGFSGINEKDGEEFEVEADVVAVASGGVCGNIPRIKQNWYKPWGSPPETILNGSHEFAMGDIHDLVEDLNGNVTHGENLWNYAAGVHHHRPRRPNHGLSLIPPRSALWLDSQGRRFGPMPLVSSFDTRFLVEQICQQEHKYSWQLLNYKIAVREMAISGSEFNQAIRDKNLFKFLSSVLFGNKKLVDELIDQNQDFVVTNSIPELVEKMNQLAGQNLVQTELVQKSVQAYDAQVGRGKRFFNDEQLRRIAHVRQYRGDRLRTAKFKKIDDARAYPLVAIREFIISRKSLGGIQTDLHCQVLGQDDKPISGLYAVGEAAGFGGGGMHGRRALEGTFLGGCVLTGRMAAAAITGKPL